MKFFEEPIVEVIEFSVEDVITTSEEELPDLDGLLVNACI